MNDVKVAISEEFLDAFAEVPRGKQRKVRRFFRKFRRDPRSSGINYEKINGVMDPNLRSVRIDQEYRGIILKPEQGNVYMLLWVDHHDDAYQWAENKVVQIHPDTGSIQVIPVEEGEAIDHAELQEDEEGEADDDRDDLFAEYRDRQLIRLGIPEQLMPLVRSIRTEEKLDELQSYLPEEAYEALFLLAAGYSEREVDRELAYKRSQQEEVDTEDFVAALENPNTKRRFTVLEDEKELERMLDAPLEKWRVFLHPSQRRIVTMNANGPVRVLGGAGTGKTVVAMHRAVWLAENVFTDPDDRLLFTTYTRNLAADIRENLAALTSKDVLDRIEVANLDAWVRSFLGEQGDPYQIDYGHKTKDLWEQALLVGPEDADPTFLRNEWEQVIQPNGIVDKSDYMRVSRVGRGTPLRRSDRREIWPVFDEYRSLLEEHQLRERADAFRKARQILVQKGDILPYASILVDEAQDMGMQAFKLIRQMIPGGDQPHDVFIVGDAHQRIYDRRVVLKHCGINIQGARGQKLRINYRTTEENRRWAVRLLQGVDYDDLDGGVDDQAVYKSLIQGEEPLVKAFSTFREEAEAIVEYIKSQVQIGGEARDICIIARTQHLLDNYEGALKSAGLKTYPIKKNAAEDRSADGVRLATMHRAKGLEFEQVVVAGVNDENVPNRQALSEASDDADKERILKHERSLLYVAATRAKRRVIVTCHETPSRWLPISGESSP